jgi:hypothetical protein
LGRRRSRKGRRRRGRRRGSRRGKRRRRRRGGEGAGEGEGEGGRRRRRKVKREEGEEKSERRKGEEDGPMAGLAGVSVLRHGESDGVHHGRQQVFSDGVGIPCSSDELVKQGNLLVRGSVGRQELPEVNFNRLDLGWVVRFPRHVLRGGPILLRVVLGRYAPGRGGPEGREAL